MTTSSQCRRLDVGEGAALVGAGRGEDGVEGAARAVDEALDRRLGGAGVGEVDDLVGHPLDRDAVQGQRAAAGVAHGGGDRGAEAARCAGDEDGADVRGHELLLP